MLLPRSLVLSLSLILSFATPSPAEPPKKLLLLGQGPDGHPPETHEYMAGLQILTKCLKPVIELDVSVVRADEPWKEGPDLLERADGVVLYLAEGARWLANDPRRHQAFAKLASRKGGLVALHWAIGTRDAGPIDNYLKLLGGCHGGPDRKFQVLETEAHITNPQHPITFGISNFRIHDEFYYRLKFAKPEGNIQPLLRASIDGQDETVAWSWERPDGGRSFGFSGLHFHENWGRAEYRRLVAQGVLWTLKLPIPKEGLPVKVMAEDLKLK
jgi:hypothetical protein